MRDKELETRLRYLTLQLDSWKKLHDFLKWALTDGEKSAASLDYAPIPDAIEKQLLKRLEAVKAK